MNSLQFSRKLVSAGRINSRISRKNEVGMVMPDLMSVGRIAKHCDNPSGDCLHAKSRTLKESEFCRSC